MMMRRSITLISLLLQSVACVWLAMAPLHAVTVVIHINAHRFGGAAPPADPEDPYFDSVQLLVHADGADGGTALTDSSSYARTLTVTGNANTDTAEKKFGTASIAYDGAGDYVTVASSAAFNFGSTTDFTVEAWVYVTSASSIYSNWFSTAGRKYYFGLYNGYVLAGNASTNVFLNTTDFTPYRDKWTHVAHVRYGPVHQLFIDGVLKQTVMNATVFGETGVAYIGYDTLLGAVLNGWVDEARVTHVSRYSSSFTVPADQYAEVQQSTIPAIPTTNMVWSIDADAGVRTTGGGLAADGEVVESWDDQVGSSDPTYITGTQGIYHASGGPNNTAWVELPGGQYDWTAVAAKTVVVIYKLNANTINFPLQDVTFGIGSYATYWGEYRAALVNLAQNYDGGGGGFWWWADRPGGGGKPTYWTYATTNRWFIMGIRMNSGLSTDMSIDSTRDRRYLGIFSGGIRKAVAYSSYLSNADLETIFRSWGMEHQLSVRQATSGSMILDRAEY